MEFSRQEYVSGSFPHGGTGQLSPPRLLWCFGPCLEACPVFPARLGQALSAAPHPHGSVQDVHSPLLCLRPSASHPQGVHGTDLPWPAQLQKRLSLPSPPPQPFTTGTCRLCEVPHFSFQLCVKGLEARCNHTVGGQQCAALNIPNSPSPEAGAGRRAPVTPVKQK